MHIRKSKGDFRDSRADSITARLPMALLVLAKLIILLSVANGPPVLVTRLLGYHFSQAVDGGMVVFDRRRLFGPSKTIRGALASIALTTAAACLLDLDARVGALAGGMVLLGDLFSSFVKRRLGFPPSAQAIGLDQIPEALFPALACSILLPLGALDIVVVVAGFSIGALLLSPVFYRMGLRDRPF